MTFCGNLLTTNELIIYLKVAIFRSLLTQQIRKQQFSQIQNQIMLLDCQRPLIRNDSSKIKLFQKFLAFFFSFFRRVRATSMTQRRVENARVHFWTFSPVSVNDIFTHKAYPFNKWRSVCYFKPASINLLFNHYKFYSDDVI